MLRRREYVIRFFSYILENAPGTKWKKPFSLIKYWIRSFFYVSFTSLEEEKNLSKLSQRNEEENEIDNNKWMLKGDDSFKTKIFSYKSRKKFVSLTLFVFTLFASLWPFENLCLILKFRQQHCWNVRGMLSFSRALGNID